VEHVNLGGPGVEKVLEGPSIPNGGKVLVSGLGVIESLVYLVDFFNRSLELEESAQQGEVSPFFRNLG
jgi:hypothetical protein